MYTMLLGYRAIRVLFLAILLGATWAQAGTTVNIHPGTDIPTVVTDNPPGTTFVIYPGLYRLQTPIAAKDGDTFIGQKNCTPLKRIACTAILNGSELLTSIQHNGTYYYVTGQTQQGQITITTTQCEPELPGYPTAYPGCIYPEDLYFDDVPLVHVTSLADIGPGKWFFDYTKNTIYFHDNPAGHTVETSVVPSAFALGPANNVTIERLTVEKFAAPVLKGAIAGSPTSSMTTGIDWVVQNNEILLSHGAGVAVNFGWQVLNNYMHDNGQVGVGGGLGDTSDPSNVLIEGNELANNNYAHVKPGFAAGGAKTSGTLDIVYRDNYSHDNEGAGFHTDDGSVGDLFDHNTSANNTDDGILHEISYDGTFRNNLLVGNAYIFPTSTYWLNGAGLLSSTSQNDEAYCNTVEVSAQGGNGIDIIGQPREGQGGSDISKNNYFHHNTVVFDGPSGWTGGGRDSKTDICCVDFFALNNFDYNSYHLPSLTERAFIWNHLPPTLAQFQAGGQEVHGSADTNNTSSVPVVLITSPSDMSTVSGVVTVAGNVNSSVSKVEFYVDWKLLQTESASPFSFSWNTSGVKTGNHTVAAMAFNTQGVSACYAVMLRVQ